MGHRVFSALLLALFLLGGLGGVAWAQGRNNLQGQQQLLQTDRGNQYLQPLDLSIDKYNSQDNDQKAARFTESPKNTVSAGPTGKSLGPSSRQYGMSKAQKQGPQVGALGRSIIGTGYNPSRSFGSKSFLDGYLLRSLHDNDIPRKRARNEEKPQDGLSSGGKTSF
jgi:hypothetical protein